MKTFKTQKNRATTKLISGLIVLCIIFAPTPTAAFSINSVFESGAKVTSFIKSIFSSVESFGAKFAQKIETSIGSSNRAQTANTIYSTSEPTSNNPTSPTIPTSIATTTHITQNITNPVVERVVEKLVVSNNFVTTEHLQSALNQTNNKFASELSQKINNFSSGSNTPISNVYQQIAHTNKIDYLANVTFSNPTISNGTISNTAISGGTISGVSVNATTLSADSFSVASLTLSGLSANSLLSTDSSGTISATTTPTFGSFNATSTTATTTISTGGLLVGTNNFLVQQNSGRIGLGTLAPASQFHLRGSGTGGLATMFEGLTNVAPIMYIDGNTTSASDRTVGAYAKLVADYSGTNSNIKTGLQGVVEVPSTNSQNSNSDIRGVYGVADYWGTGTISSITGGMFLADIENTGDVTQAVGANGIVYVDGASDISTMAGLKAYTQTFNAGANVTSAYGLHVQGLNTGGTITNGYGVYIDSIAGTNAFGLYQASTALRNYFAGNVGIGTTTPGQKLSVAGDILGNNIINSYFTSTSTIATSTISTGGFSVGTNQFVVQQGSGRIGVGTTNPTATLDIGGTLTYDSTSAFLSLLNSSDGNNVFFRARNTSSGSAAITNLQFGNDGAAAAGGISVYSTGYNTTGAAIADSIRINSSRIGGLSLSATNAGGDMRFYTGGSADVNQRMIIDSSGNVGIGTTTPGAKLSLNNLDSWQTYTGQITGATGGVGALLSTQIITDPNPASASSPYRSNWFETQVSLTGDPSGARTYRGIENYISTPVGSTFGHSSMTLVGTHSSVAHQGTGRLFGITGSESLSNINAEAILTSTYGSYNQVSLTASTTITNATGALGFVSMSSGGAGSTVTTTRGLYGAAQFAANFTATNVALLDADLTANAAAITNLYGLRVDDFTNATGNITNTYGAYIGDITTGTQTNKYSFYASDANAYNYFAGNVGIGTTDPGTYKLNVNGNVNVTGTVTSHGGMELVAISEGTSTSNSSVNVADIPITGLTSDDKLFVVVEHSFATNDDRSPASTPTISLNHSDGVALVNSGELKPGAWSESTGVRWYSSAEFYMSPDPTSSTQISVNGWGKPAYVAATIPVMFGAQVTATTPWTGSWSMRLNKSASSLTSPSYSWRIMVYKINGSADIAENYPSDEILEPGDVVVFDPSGDKKIMKAGNASSTLAGIVSTAPGITLGDGIGTSLGIGGLKFGQKNNNDYPLALAGRVPVKISEENGIIKVGDYLTTSMTRTGYAMKMTESGQSIGVAMEDSSSEKDKILTFVKLGYQFVEPEEGYVSSFVSAIETHFTSLTDKLKSWFADASNGIGDFFANRIRTKEVCVSDESGETCITKSQLDSLLANSGNNQPSHEPEEQPEGPTDSIPPVISITGSAILQIPLNSNYSDLGATVTDLDDENNANNNLGIYFNVNGVDVQSIQLDTATETIHTVVYSAVDEGGNWSYATRSVEVIEE
ncbi:MAG: hypothetical protein V4690_02775 [Patescibacteria group bacterium]